MIVTRKKIKTQNVSIAPLIDIVFLLLIFFMISTDFIKPILQLTLPKAQTEDKLKKVEIVVSAAKDGTIAINDQVVSLEQYSDFLRKTMLEKNKMDVLFRGDENIPYKTFVMLMDKAKIAGAKSFSIEHGN